MAANIPASMRAADLARFAMRAAQTEKVKPVIAYWCNYWIVNQILSKGLHTTDDESMAYTTTLMDKLELTKSEHAENNAIIEDAAGRAYAEQFGLETFQRADNAIEADQVTRQTADTFLAAATFLDLSQIWASPAPEIAAKIKYAKFHAVRIAKALKAGTDPNLSNPRPDPIPELEPLDPDDPDVKMLDASLSDHGPHTSPKGVTLEEVPDEDDHAPTHIHSESAPSAANTRSDPISSPNLPSPQEDPRAFYNSNIAKTDDNEVSPLEETPPDRSNSTGGGYFPTVPTDTSRQQAHGYAEIPFDASSDGRPQLPTAPDFAPSSPHIHTQPRLDPQHPQEPRRHPSSQSHAPSSPRSVASTTRPQSSQQRQTAVSSEVPLDASEEAIAAAQKHARWAISALNFEDVKTAVQELHVALRALGAE